MRLALVQPLYRARGSPGCAQISNHGPMCNCSRRSSLRALPHPYAFCTDQGLLCAPTKGLHFQVLHPLSFLFICSFHWCKHCTALEVSPNVRKFPMTALFGMGANGVVCGPVLVGTLFAPTQGLHFHALHPFSFLFICTLHWCKHCTVQEVTTNMRKFRMTWLC